MKEKTQFSNREMGFFYFLGIFLVFWWKENQVDVSIGIYNL